jgi:hypothetical protein
VSEDTPSEGHPLQGHPHPPAPAMSERGGKKSRRRSKQTPQKASTQSGPPSPAKYAGSATMLCAPSPDMLQIPKFVLRQRAAAAAAAAAKLPGEIPPRGSSIGARRPASTPAPFDTAAQQQQQQQQQKQKRRTPPADQPPRELIVEAHDLVPFFGAGALGTSAAMDGLQLNHDLHSVPTTLPPDASVSVREWTDDGYFKEATVQQVNVRAPVGAPSNLETAF